MLWLHKWEFIVWSCYIRSDHEPCRVSSVQPAVHHRGAFCVCCMSVGFVVAVSAWQHGGGQCQSGRWEAFDPAEVWSRSESDQEFTPGWWVAWTHDSASAIQAGLHSLPPTPPNIRFKQNCVRPGQVQGNSLPALDLVRFNKVNPLYLQCLAWSLQLHALSQQSLLLKICLVSEASQIQWIQK